MIALVKVRWDSKRGLELTWESKDQMRSKCPQLLLIVLMPRVVKSRDDIFSRWGYCDNCGLSSDQLEWVLWYAPWLSDQLEWICGMLHGLVINWSSSAIETSRNRVNVFFIYHSNDLIGFKGELNGAKIERSG
ncbi:hypothetical protein Tco_1026730 [Tanacetum coccineum]